MLRVAEDHEDSRRRGPDTGSRSSDVGHANSDTTQRRQTDAKRRDVFGLKAEKGFREVRSFWEWHWAKFSDLEARSRLVLFLSRFILAL